MSDHIDRVVEALETLAETLPKGEHQWAAEDAISLIHAQEAELQRLGWLGEETRKRWMDPDFDGLPWIAWMDKTFGGGTWDGEGVSHDEV